MTITTERRSFIQGAGIAARWPQQQRSFGKRRPAFSQSNQQTGARTMPYQVKPLSLDPKIDQRHLGKGFW